MRQDKFDVVFGLTFFSNRRRRRRRRRHRRRKNMENNRYGSHVFRFFSCLDSPRKTICRYGPYGSLFKWRKGVAKHLVALIYHILYGSVMERKETYRGQSVLVFICRNNIFVDCAPSSSIYTHVYVDPSSGEFMRRDFFLSTERID